jgi:2,4-dienoyl-CoA reductase-like NADH-dependent reductase (Old Yellow Enzyme family)
VGPGAEPFGPGELAPRALGTGELRGVADAFAAAARRAAAAGMQVAEVHAAHGYLLHQFLSPLSNHRTDAYGGDFEGRIRLTLEVVEAVRAEWPADLPVFVRVSATDYAEGGWDVEQTVALVRHLAALGVDLIDCSSGGLASGVRYPVSPATRCRSPSGCGARWGGDGRGRHDHHARAGRRRGARGARGPGAARRELLRDPHWPLRAARALGAPAPVAAAVRAGGGLTPPPRAARLGRGELALVESAARGWQTVPPRIPRVRSPTAGAAACRPVPLAPPPHRRGLGPFCRTVPPLRAAPA